MLFYLTLHHILYLCYTSPLTIPAHPPTLAGYGPPFNFLIVIYQCAIGLIVAFMSLHITIDSRKNKYGFILLQFLKDKNILKVSACV